MQKFKGPRSKFVISLLGLGILGLLFIGLHIAVTQPIKNCRELSSRVYTQFSGVMVLSMQPQSKGCFQADTISQALDVLADKGTHLTNGTLTVSAQFRIGTDFGIDIDIVPDISADGSIFDVLEFAEYQLFEQIRLDGLTEPKEVMLRIEVERVIFYASGKIFPDRVQFNVTN